MDAVKTTPNFCTDYLQVLRRADQTRSEQKMPRWVGNIRTKIFQTLLCFLMFLPVPNVPLSAAETGIIGSIKPIHSLVANVVGDLHTPFLIVGTDASPHSFALRPSHASAMQSAKVIFWVGPELEQFLPQAIVNLAPTARSVQLLELTDLRVLSARDAGLFEHEDHHDEHAEDALHDEEHSDIDSVDHISVDPHIWLDPENAKIMVGEIARVLMEIYPANADIFRENAESTLRQLDALNTELQTLLAPVRDQTFVVFHDGYQYFEARFGLEIGAALTVNPEAGVGVRRLDEIGQMMRAQSVTCIFAEPQFSGALVEMLASSDQINVGTLDPIGAGLAEGPELYFDLLRNMAEAARNCLET